MKLRTRYQRQVLAVKAANILREHSDPKVQGLGLAIEYALAAPLQTLNNVLDQFPKELRKEFKEVEESTTADKHLLFQLRKKREKIR